MAQKIKIKYPTWERFESNSHVLRQGKLFLPTAHPLPIDSAVTIHFFLPGVSEELIAAAVVISHTPNGDNRPGMTIAFVKGSEKTLARLLTIHEAETEKTSIKEEAISLDWLRDAFTHDEKMTFSPQDEEEPEPAPASPPPVISKKNLSPEETTLVRPATEFLINMTKAMLRSGYYDPSHPASKEAKHGLYTEFRDALGQTHEIMFTLNEEGAEQDISITGILDEPVSVRRIIGAGQAGLFLPKIQEYFDRKNLVSLTLKKTLSHDHFHRFIDIMHSPEGGGDVGGDGDDEDHDEILSLDLAHAGITEISAVFRGDMLQLEKSLPWRVQVAIHRLFKDIKMLPLYQDKTDEEIKEMKVHIVEDILRPLKHPKLLADLVIHSHLIASNTDDLDPKDMERTIISSFPLTMLVETSRHILDEMMRINKIPVESGELHEEHDAVRFKKQQTASIKRMLHLLGRRMTQESAKGNAFLEELYQHKILNFEELPPKVQYRVTSRRMAKELIANGPSYCEQLRRSTGEDVSLLLRTFRRAASLLAEHKAWPTILDITRAAGNVPQALVTEVTGITNGAQFILQDAMDELAVGLSGSVAGRGSVIHILELLGETAVPLLNSILLHYEDNEARKQALEALVTIGPQARPTFLAILDDPVQPWGLIKNAILVLGHIGNREEDLIPVRKFLHHANAKVREEALMAAVKLKAKDIEPILMKAIADKDEKVQKRAISSLNLISPLSEETITKLLDMIIMDPSQDQEVATAQEKSAAQIIKALGSMAGPRNPEKIGECILSVAQQITDHQAGFLHFFSISKESERSVVLTAALEALAKIGAPQALEYLHELADGDDEIAEQARQALNTRRRKK